jgi:tetratricopeptide (TPR) repeat protein
MARAEHRICSPLDRARAYLAAGDHAAAANWARRALAEDRDPLDAHRLLSRVFGESGQHQRALEEELTVLERVGFEADQVLRLARLYARVGNAAAGMQLVVRFHDQLATRHVAELRETLRDLIAEMPSRLAFRMICGSRAVLGLDLVAESLGPAGRSVYARRGGDAAGGFGLALARSAVGFVTQDHDEDGYRAASGVEPIPGR